MQIDPTTHLTYCTNIHPGETWEEVHDSLQHILTVKQKLSVQGAFGIGLRLSARAANELARTQVLRSFQQWLRANDCYVFTMNGFPYGEFHGEAVKANVHAPDWTTRERVTYTTTLFDLLADLLPEGITEGGISTSPLSYRPWFTTDQDLRKATQAATLNLAEVVLHLVRLKERTGKSLHLDIEPEPDGILEDTHTFVKWYNEVLMTEGVNWLHYHLRTTRAEAEAAIREHLCLCYDVCHFAVAYEQPAEVLQTLSSNGIRIGKLQISAALKRPLSGDPQDVAAARTALDPYDESTYLHQAVLKKTDGTLDHFPDLAPALKALDDTAYTELRTHFHVPIYTDNYGQLLSTNDAIAETLRLWKDQPFTNHLEVETYTWDVLPGHQRLSLTDSITRELNWVLDQLPSGKSLHPRPRPMSQTA